MQSKERKSKGKGITESSDPVIKPGLFLSGLVFFQTICYNYKKLRRYKNHDRARSDLVQKNKNYEQGRDAKIY